MPRLHPGDVAVLDHEDLDRVAAEALVRSGVSAVVNAAACTSGRYPNSGPRLLVEAGVPVLERVGDAVFSTVRDGDVVHVEGSHLCRGGEVVASGRVLDLALVEADAVAARENLSEALAAFTSNTMAYVERERSLLLDGVGLPSVRTVMQGRHVLVVVRGHHYREDLAALRGYVREYRPVLLGVDGGADALLAEGWTPDLVLGDMDSVSDDALRCGAEVVVHAYPDGSAPGAERARALGLEPVLFPAAATSEDCALLLADGLGARLVVAVGSHGTLEEFLDKGRAGMASTFLTRLRVGGKLVDAKGVSRLHRSRVSPGLAVALVASAVAVLLVALTLTPAGQIYLDLVLDWLREVLG